MLLLLDRGGEGRRLAVSDEELAQVAERVERLRGLRFEKPPEPRIVSSDEARREALAELERVYPPERRRDDEDLLKLLGLLEPDDSFRSIEEAIFGGQVAGYYDTRRDSLALVQDVGGIDATHLEITLAHELVHALEDQHYELTEMPAGADDRSTAYAALVEGTATFAEVAYLQRYISGGQQLITGLSAAGSGALEEFNALPAYIRESLLFPYLEGERFVRTLHGAARDWRLVDISLDKHPPRSTEQILHPEKYLRFEPPVELELTVGEVLDTAWKRASRGTIGEFDTAALLRRGGGEADPEDAAEGWGGGSYELWRRDGTGDCPSPCRERLALVLAWTWDTRGDAREFRRALDGYVESALEGQAAVTGEDGAITLAIAPTPELARRLASDALKEEPSRVRR